MRNWFERYLWSSHFWALLGVFGCATGLLFQQLAENGLELWFMGHIFFFAAYIVRQDEHRA